MLSRYEGKNVRITTESGDVFTGVAESYPSGYGLHAFNRAEESLQLGDDMFFQSDIRKIELLSEPVPVDIPGNSYDALIAELLEAPCWLVDILPERVPKNAAGQYFSVDRYFRQPARLATLYRKFAELLLRLNCYTDLVVSFDGGEHWEQNPDPETLANMLTDLPQNAFFRAVFPKERAMADLDAGDTCLVFSGPDAALLNRLQKLAQAEGLFVWQSEQEGGCHAGTT